ncbi:hypothetical protein VTI74DRAFT_8568 [Chaetomium olivicolor]
MESLATRPALSCCRRAVASGSSTAAPSRLLLNTTLPSGARPKSSAARTRAALRIPQHPSFLNLVAGSDKHGNPPAGADPSQPPTDQIIFNPPSSAPSVYYTPFKFLPPTDPRRRENLTSLFSSSSSSTPTTTSQSSALSPEDLPTVRGIPPTQVRHHLTKADIEEMRRLRATDPVKNSVQNLALQFKCTKLFVMMCCQAPKEHKERVAAEEEKIKARWGPRRRQAREDRARRWGMVFNGEL